MAWGRGEGVGRVADLWQPFSGKRKPREKNQTSWMNLNEVAKAEH